MKNFEAKVLRYLQEEEWEVHKNGWPDFICHKKSLHGDNIIIAVEVKDWHDKLSEAQINMHGILRKAGIPVLVITPEDLKGKHRAREHGLFCSQKSYLQIKQELKNTKESFDKRIEYLGKEIDKFVDILNVSRLSQDKRMEIARIALERVGEFVSNTKP